MHLTVSWVFILSLSMNFLAISSCDVESFVTTLVLLETNVVYNQFLKLFSAESVNLKRFDRVCCHVKPSCQQFCTSER